MPARRLKKIQTKDLRVGMFVHDVRRKWFHHPWPHKSKLINSISDIEQLKEFGIKEVTIDLAREVPAKKKAPEDEESAKQDQEINELQDRIGDEAKDQPESVPLEVELPRARKTYLDALETTREFLADTRAGRKINVARVRDNVEEMIESAFRNRDASLALIKLKTYDEYTLTHSLNVGVLAISMGCHINYPRGKIRQLGIGAIFHDLGKTKIPSKIINKKSQLTEEEFKTIKFHPVIGAQILEKTQDISNQSITIARHHHERIDGTGYPDGLSGNQLDPFMIISGISDVYDALSSDRIYHSSILPHEALKSIFALSV